MPSSVLCSTSKGAVEREGLAMLRGRMRRVSCSTRIAQKLPRANSGSPRPVGSGSRRGGGCCVYLSMSMRPVLRCCTLPAQKAG
jgi:hypothetical protein